MSTGAALRNPEFLKLWTGQAISMTGSQVSVLAIPLIAAVVLQAGAFELGLLRALAFVPTLVLALPAGAWLDGVRRRPVMIAADLGRASLLTLIPLAALSGLLRIELLYVVALLVGALSLLFDIAQSAWLPAAINTRHLVDANSKLELSRWTVQVVGPALAGGLVQLVGAPLAVVADSVSFLFSATLLSQIPVHESHVSGGRRSSVTWDDVLAGVRFVVRHPLLRALAGTAAFSNLFAYAQSAVLLLYVTRELGLEATAFGVIVAAFSLGGVCGSLCAARVAARLGQFGAIGVGVIVMATGDSLVAMAGGPLAFGGIAFGQFVTGFGLPICTISMLSLRQTITPENMLGRLSAASRLVSWGAIPIGALLGGALGELIGLRPTLITCAAGSAGVVACVLWALRKRSLQPTRGRWVRGKLLHGGSPWRKPRVVAALRQKYCHPEGGTTEGSITSRPRGFDPSLRSG
jgi:MFS family permease